MVEIDEGKCWQEGEHKWGVLVREGQKQSWTDTQKENSSVAGEMYVSVWVVCRREKHELTSFDASGEDEMPRTPAEANQDLARVRVRLCVCASERACVCAYVSTCLISQDLCLMICVCLCVCSCVYV